MSLQVVDKPETESLAPKKYEAILLSTQEKVCTESAP